MAQSTEPAFFRTSAFFTGARIEENPDPQAHPNDRYTLQILGAPGERIDVVGSRKGLLHFAGSLSDLVHDMTKEA
jgi:hypothetical protein